MTRPRALLVAPILPAAARNGLAMRVGLLLEALAADHEVTFLLVPIAGAGESTEFLERHARRLAVAPLHGALDPLFTLSASILDPAERLAALCDYPRPLLCRWATRPGLDETSAVVSAAGSATSAPDRSVAFDTVVVARSYVAPYAADFLAREPAGTPLRVLDLDDDERTTHDRLSALSRLQGRHEEARFEASEATKYGHLEEIWLPRFDLLLAASELHEAAVKSRHPGVPVSVQPNAVEVPEAMGRARRSVPLRLLFVGNLSYEPNIDAVRWFVERILPRIAGGPQVELRIVGSHPPPAVLALGTRGVEICPNPTDLEPHYGWANVALAPLRAGGGTRIKILEAFAAGVPVVATRIGAEGLAVRDREHLLLADDEAGLAAACRCLGDEQELGLRLAVNAFDLVRHQYSRRARVAELRRLLAAAVEPTRPGTCEDVGTRPVPP